MLNLDFKCRMPHSLTNANGKSSVTLIPVCVMREEGRFVWGGCGKDEATSLRPRQTESSLEFMTVGVMWLVTQ